MSSRSLASALTHPVRLRVLERVVDADEVSPARLADDLGLPLANVAYHVRYLSELGLLRLERTIPVRGTVQHVYAATDAEAVRRLLTLSSELVGPQPHRT